MGEYQDSTGYSGNVVNWVEDRQIGLGGHHESDHEQRWQGHVPGHQAGHAGHGGVMGEYQDSTGYSGNMVNWVDDRQIGLGGHHESDHEQCWQGHVSGHQGAAPQGRGAGGPGKQVSSIMCNIKLNFYLYVINCRMQVVLDHGLTIFTSVYHGEMSGEGISELL